MYDKFKVAAAQLAPIYLDSMATTMKMCEYIEKAADQNVKLIVFPELMISMYPTYCTPEYRELYKEAAIDIPGPETKVLCDIARKHDLCVVTGLIERDKDNDGINYNSSIVIANNGHIVGVHRKIILPSEEKIFFTEGSKRDVRIFDMPPGRVGIAMCYEHLNPLYRKALYLMNEQMHCALWVNTEKIKHILDSTTKVTAIEGVVFVVLAAQVTPKRDKLGKWGVKGAPRQLLPFIGGSGVLDPNGEYIEGPVYGKEKSFKQTST